MQRRAGFVSKIKRRDKKGEWKLTEIMEQNELTVSESNPAVGRAWWCPNLDK